MISMISALERSNLAAHTENVRNQNMPAYGIAIRNITVPPKSQLTVLEGFPGCRNPNYHVNFRGSVVCPYLNLKPCRTVSGAKEEVACCDGLVQAHSGGVWKPFWSNEGRSSAEDSAGRRLSPIGDENS